MHVRAGVDAKLLVRRGRAREGLGVAAQMQSHAGPVADAEHRYGDPVPLRLGAAKRAAVEIVAEPEVKRVGVPPIRMMAGGATDDVMHEMRHVPIGHEQAEQSAVEQRVAIEIGETFPGDDRLQ